MKPSESVVDFAHWAVAQLGLEALDGARDEVRVPEEARGRFDGRESVALLAAAATATDGATDSAATSATVQPAVLAWLCDELRGQGAAVHTRPRRQPEAVSALAPALLAAYQVDGGQIHLGGCRLEDRPFLRLTFAAGPVAAPSAVSHVYVSEDGSRAPDELVAALGLDDLLPIQACPPRIDDGELAAMIAAAQSIAVEEQAGLNTTTDVDQPLAAAVVWAKYAVGRIEFTVGDQAVSLPFDGWAHTLAPPPYVCPLTDISTFHLATTDDGRIAAKEGLAACMRSGQWVLAEELVRCSVTGQHVLPEFVTNCPVSGQPALDEELAECPVCRERVSRPLLSERGCAGCEAPPAVSADDPRMAWILEEHPPLGRWRRWRLSETQSVYILEAAGLLQRLLIVLDRTTLDIKHMAHRSRFARRWAPLAPDRWQQFLR